MENQEVTIEILNDLIEINNDRIVGYDRALKETHDEDLKALFPELIKQSHQCKMELGTEVQVLGGEIDTATTASGKIYRAWMDVKAAFTGHDRKTVLANCEFGEDAAQKAYKTALADETLPAYLKEIITKQQQVLKGAHDQVKQLRDQAAE
jgi:uncharacterized protein (TIGR02284 family)